MYSLQEAQLILYISTDDDATVSEYEPHSVHSHAHRHYHFYSGSAKQINGRMFLDAINAKETLPLQSVKLFLKGTPPIPVSDYTW